MFKRFELNIICYITIKFIYFVSCSLHFRCVIDKVLVGLTFGAMKLRITTDQETSLNLVESKLHLVGSNRIIITKELHGWGWRFWWCWVGVWVVLFSSLLILSNVVGWVGCCMMYVL